MRALDASLKVGFLYYLFRYSLPNLDTQKPKRIEQGSLPCDAAHKWLLIVHWLQPVKCTLISLKGFVIVECNANDSILAAGLVVRFTKLSFTF
jgi:hypothetical protein